MTIYTITTTIPMKVGFIMGQNSIIGGVVIQVITMSGKKTKTEPRANVSKIFKDGRDVIINR